MGKYMRLSLAKEGEPRPPSTTTLLPILTQCTGCRGCNGDLSLLERRFGQKRVDLFTQRKHGIMRRLVLLRRVSFDEDRVRQNFDQKLARIEIMDSRGNPNAATVAFDAGECTEHRFLLCATPIVAGRSRMMPLAVDFIGPPLHAFVKLR